MAYSYGHRATAFNGVTTYLQDKYPNSWVVKSMKEGLQENQKKTWVNWAGHYKFMQEYRKSRGSIPSKNYFKNALYIQNDFKPFAEYCKQNLTENE